MSGGRCIPTDLDATGNAVRANLRMLRMHRGWTIAELAVRLDERGWPASETVLSRIETGRRHVRVDELALFAKLYHVELADLLEPMSLPAARKASA
jgi:transcriptional regulator with XRE-family HTH domain